MRHNIQTVMVLGVMNDIDTLSLISIPNRDFDIVRYSWIQRATCTNDSQVLKYSLKSQFLTQNMLYNLNSYK